jgi:predicted AAA+ superfamily ATPase
MDINIINNKLALGEIDLPNMLPHVAKLKKSPYVFKIDFGLKKLPLEPGILMIRGARQYGKSTWLEQEILKTIEQFGAGTVYYLNGENTSDVNALERSIEELIVAFPQNAPVKRIFIDEITANPKWEIALKRLADQGKLDEILVITTGSKATDLRRGSEKLPGRKGKLARTNYLFTPISYREFIKVCGADLQTDALTTYLLSGGSPVACSELAVNNMLPDYVIQLVRDWVEGEIAFSGRTRSSLFNILNTIIRFGGTPIGQAKLAREAGLANNTAAVGYIEILNDLGCIIPTYPWDQHRKLLILRKPCKYHFTNLLAAVAYNPARLRSPNDFLALPNTAQGMWYEWLIAQELARRAAIRGEEILAPLAFWQNKEHEIDFVSPVDGFLEIKRGGCSPIEFSWFTRQFPKQKLTVINSKKFATDSIQGISIEDFLLAAEI